MRGVSLIDSFQSSDSRGSFLKILKHEEILEISDFNLEEVFLTASVKGTIRGMHLQIGQASNWRFIQVLNGQAFDVLLDLRRGEPSFSQTQVNLLSAESPQTLVVPPGVAHGFQALTDVEILYLTSYRYDASRDKGVNPFSIGITWPLEVTSISTRDLNLPSFKEFIE
jgi:dTDP-4-dehydrorhamnose 3,5-epimerase